MLGSLGWQELLIILAILALVFGASRVADLGGVLGRGIREFRSEAMGDEAKAEHDWYLGMDRYIVHQVSSVHTRLLCEQLSIDPAKVPLTYPKYGNVGPASIPITLAEESKKLNKGDRVLLMGVGSGLNTAMLELAW